MSPGNGRGGSPTAHFGGRWKQFAIAGPAGALAVERTALAQPSAPTPKTTPAPKAEATAGQAEKPAAAPRPKKAATGENAQAGHAAPKAQPNTAEEATAPGAMALGSVQIPKGVKADGKELAAGTYQVRLTADEAKPDAKGSSEKLERWVEFVKGGQVVGREVVSIVPSTEKQLVQKDSPPAANGSKVETLKGGDYVRVWINRGGNYYLVHLVKAT